jgi:hypothetical protein
LNMSMVKKLNQGWKKVKNQNKNNALFFERETRLCIGA